MLLTGRHHVLYFAPSLIRLCGTQDVSQIRDASWSIIDLLADYLAGLQLIRTFDTDVTDSGDRNMFIRNKWLLVPSYLLKLIFFEVLPAVSAVELACMAVSRHARLSGTACDNCSSSQQHGGISRWTQVSACGHALYCRYANQGLANLMPMVNDVEMPDMSRD